MTTDATPTDTRLEIARLVAEHWRDASMTYRNPLTSSTWAVVGHACALILAALDGEQDPTQLGIDQRAADKVREIVAKGLRP